MMNDEHRLAGRNIWVIGASIGIGAALAAISRHVTKQ
jgi:short-subunit dehydrogenase